MGIYSYSERLIVEVNDIRNPRYLECGAIVCEVLFEGVIVFLHGNER